MACDAAPEPKISRIPTYDKESETCRKASRSDFRMTPVQQSTGSSHPPSDGDTLTILTAQARHDGLVPLMRIVYGKIPTDGENGISYCAGESNARIDLGISHMTSSQSTNGQKRKRDGDSPPPDPNDSRRTKGCSPQGSKSDIQRKLARPFYKYDPSKYCGNDTTGSKYRSCATPEFPDIRRLK